MIFFDTYANRKPGAPPSELVVWDPKLFLYVTFGTIGIVAVGSLYKTAVLANEGSVVAESLGGRLVDFHTTRPDERQLRNLIGEMAIAAGVPVPKIYVLDDEKGNNTALDRFALAAPQIEPLTKENERPFYMTAFDPMKPHVTR